MRPRTAPWVLLLATTSLTCLTRVALAADGPMAAPPPASTAASANGTPTLPSATPASSSTAATTPAVLPEDEARRKEASDRYQRAVELFKEGDTKLAIIEFRRAYALVPNFQVLYNIGVASDRLGRYAESVLAYEQYLKDGGRDVPPARVEEVQNSLKTLRQRTAYLTLLIDETKAEVFLDGDKIGESPMAETLVGAGTHELRVTKAGFENTSQTISVAGGDHSTIKVHLVQKKDPVIIGNDSGGLGPVWLGWSLTGVAAVGTVVFAVAWQNAQSAYEVELKQQTTKTLLDQAKSKATTLQAATFVLGGATLIAAGVSLYFTLTRGNSASDPKKKPATARVWFDGSYVQGQF